MSTNDNGLSLNRISQSSECCLHGVGLDFSPQSSLHQIIQILCPLLVKDFHFSIPVELLCFLSSNFFLFFCLNDSKFMTGTLLCSCSKAAPDFQETRPRNYVLSASASAVRDKHPSAKLTC